MINIRDIIFGLFGTHDNVTDINKDSNGKGTYERYNEIIGKDIDEEIRININKLTERNLDPKGALSNLLPYLEDRVGSTLFMGSGIDWRRRVVSKILSWYKIRSTRRCYQVMFKMLGFDSVTINENFVQYGFDSLFTFDDEDRVFDMYCSNCIEYNIELTGSVAVSPEITEAIYSIIAFNEPINGKLTGVTYNGNPLVNEIINIEILDNGDLVYNNEYDPLLELSIVNGDLIVGGANRHHYSIVNGDLIYTF